jgi:hypothetical protein
VALVLRAEKEMWLVSVTGNRPKHGGGITGLSTVLESPTISGGKELALSSLDQLTDAT